MTRPAWTADQLQTLEYLSARLSPQAEAIDLPDDPLELYLWTAAALHAWLGGDKPNL